MEVHLLSGISPWCSGVQQWRCTSSQGFPHGVAVYSNGGGQEHNFTLSGMCAAAFEIRGRCL